MYITVKTVLSIIVIKQIWIYKNNIPMTSVMVALSGKFENVLIWLMIFNLYIVQIQIYYRSIMN